MLVGKSNMSVQPTDLLFNNFNQLRKVPEIDTNGGTILSIEEREEIDPTDNCKVQVIVYHILSADGSEESTTTTRRKLKVNCTQSLRRLEFTDGKEAKVEEKTELITGDLYGFHEPVIQDNSQHLTFQTNDPNSQFFLNDMYRQSEAGFMNMLNQEKNTFLELFPDLFSEMRTKPKFFEMPSTKAETIVNADGSTTTKYHSSKSYSSHFSKQETFINGVKKESKSKFRAFLEYKGPQGGFQLKMNDNADGDISEDEETENDDKTSRLALSEIADNHSGFAIEGARSIPAIAVTTAKRYDKAWYAVKELVDSEQRYVEKLRLLEDVFRKQVVDEKALDKTTISYIFANISSLYQFHNSHLLPQLMDRLREWSSCRKICDVVKKQAPFLKMYSEYTHNYKKASAVFEDCLKKKKQFAQIVKRIEKMSECENLPLVSHLICPVQRVMRYQLLLQEYKKHLIESDPDYSDCNEALSLVLEAASHANEMMRKLDRYKNVLEVQEQLGNTITLVSPSRELLKKVKLLKISSSTNKAEERILFVFNDLFLLASERNMFGVAKFKMRAIFDAYYSQIYEGDNLEREHSFYLRGTDGNVDGQSAKPSRRVELSCETAKSKNELMQVLWNVINDANDRKNSFPKSISCSSSFSSGKYESKWCAKCENDIRWPSKSIKCSGCNLKYCKRCFGNLKNEDKKKRICSSCNVNMDENGQAALSKLLTRLDMLAVPAMEGEIINSSDVMLKCNGKTCQRYFVLRKDFCLYSYGSNEDTVALAMCPVSGCEVSHINEKYGFQLKHINRSYDIITHDAASQAKWMAVLDLAANAKHPSHDSGNEDENNSGGELNNIKKRVSNLF
uniref:DH domain-containing protein n=1 Tax=Parastrongyloides trichosuri TaxID=131310 RepID=A0A0N4ZAU1_PARTI